MRRIRLMLLAGLCLVALGMGAPMVGVARGRPDESRAHPGR